MPGLEYMLRLVVDIKIQVAGLKDSDSILNLLKSFSIYERKFL